MIYVASPYSHPDAAVRHVRYERTLYYCAEQMRKGLVVFSPIVYGHQFALLGLSQTDHVWWQDFNERMLLSAESIHIFMIAGWKESEGIAHEIDFAQRHGIEVKYV